MAKVVLDATTVLRSTDQVWATLTDWSEAAELFSGARRLRTKPIDNASPSELEVERFDGGLEKVVIDELLEPSSLRYTMVEGPITTVWAWSLAPAEEPDHCLLSLHVDTKLRGPAAFFGPLYRRTVAGHNRSLLGKIKTRAEA